MDGPQDTPPSLPRSHLIQQVQELLDRVRAAESASMDSTLGPAPSLHLSQALAAFLSEVSTTDVASHIAGGKPLDHALGTLVGRQIGDYHIVRQIGRGGMGVVFEAEQVSLGRQVALKLLPPALLGDPVLRQRFEHEARAAARLHHTNIVPVFGVGEESGNPYYVMQYIAGQGLDAVLSELRGMPDAPATLGTPRAGSPIHLANTLPANPAAEIALSLIRGAGVTPTPAPRPPSDLAAKGPRGTVDSHAAGRSERPTAPSSSTWVLPGTGPANQAAHRTRRSGYFGSVALIGAQIADALDHAHAQGVLHRDVKPSNILLDHDGTAWLADFGLAKATGQQDLTGTGAVLGTIRYVPPEAFGGKTDHRGDIYALGTTLYELAALRPAFTAATQPELLRKITSEDPTPLSRVCPTIPRDLEVIIRKAMDREPTRRYLTAGALADDLRRFLDDRPIEARPLRLDERTLRWCNRNPLIATLGAVVTALLIAAVYLATTSAFLYREMARTETDARQKEQSLLVDLATYLGLNAAKDGDPARATLWFAEAATRGTDPTRIRSAQIRSAAFGRQAAQPVALLTRNNVEPLRLAYHPSGDFLLITWYDGPLQLYDPATSRDLGLPAALAGSRNLVWSDERHWLACVSEQQIEILEYPGFRPTARLARDKPIGSIALSGDGTRVALAQGSRVEIWNWTVDPATPTTTLDLPANVQDLLWSPTGRRLVVVTLDFKGRAYDVPADSTPRLLFEPFDCDRPGVYSEQPTTPVLVDEGRAVVTSAAAGRLELIDLETGRVRSSITVDAPVLKLVAGPDGHSVGIAGFAVASVWDWSDAAAAPLRGWKHGNYVYDIAWHPDQRHLLTVGEDPVARAFAVDAKTDAFPPVPHQIAARYAAIAPDGNTFATGQDARGPAPGLVRIWRWPEAPSKAVKRTPIGGVETLLSISRDGLWAIPAPWTRIRQKTATQVIDLTKGEPAGPRLQLPGAINAAAFAPDARRVLIGFCPAEFAQDERPRPDSLAQRPGLIQMWDWRVGQSLGPVLPIPSEPIGLDIAPDGTRAVVLCAGGQVLVLDVADNAPRLLHERWHPGRPAPSYLSLGRVRYTADGSGFVTWGIGERGKPWSAFVWSSDDAQLRFRVDHRDMLTTVLITEDGRLLFTASRDGQVRATRLDDGQPAAPPLEHPDWVFALDLSADGQRLATACRDKRARLWDWRRGTLAAPVLEHDDEVFCITQAMDGSHVWTTSRDGRVHCWDTQVGKPLMPPLEVGGEPLQFVFSPDRRKATVAGIMRDLIHFQPPELISIRGVSDDLTRLTRQAELRCGARLDDRGGVVNLDAAEWADLWQRTHDTRDPGPRPSVRVQ